MMECIERHLDNLEADERSTDYTSLKKSSVTKLYLFWIQGCRVVAGMIANLMTSIHGSNTATRTLKGYKMISE
eukprot:gene12597-6417_t